MSRQIPYVPMGPPRKHVSFEQMQAILRKHAPCEAELLNPTQSPQEPKAPQEKAPQAPPALKWRKLEEGVFESNKGPVLRIEGGKYFVFDRRSDKHHTAQCIGRFSDAQTAKDYVRLLP